MAFIYFYIFYIFLYMYIYFIDLFTCYLLSSLGSQVTLRALWCFLILCIQIVLLRIIIIIPIRHDNVIDLMMKITGRIIFKTTFRCPHDTIIRSKYNIQQIK